jgi:hypothetical protein
MAEFKERRRHPRAIANLEGELLAIREIYGEDKTGIKTRNISASGVYCDVSHFIEPFTQLLINVVVPVAGKFFNITCEGVVVRCEKHEEGEKAPYSIAIHFTRISDEDRQVISQFVQDSDQS